MIRQKFVLDRKKFYVELDAGFTDVTRYVLVTPPVELEWGFSGDNPVTDLLAPTGSAKFTMNNISGQFTPNGPSTLAGWRKGARFYIELTFESSIFRRFAGFIGDLIYEPARFGPNVGVTVVDWFDVASRYPMDNISIGTNKRADELTLDIINRTYIQPEIIDLNVGVNIFPLTYSSLTRKTRAYTELGKIASSEYCHIYLRKDKSKGETLKLDNMFSRHGWSPLMSIKGDSFYILKAGSPTDYILKAGSTTDRLLSGGGSVEVILDNIFLEGQLDIRDGANVLNVVEFTAYPSRVDTSDQVLFVLQEPIRIGAGQTVIVRGNYFNSTLGVQCNGMSMINPVAHVDYKAWTNSNGTGTDFTTSLAVTPEYNSDGFNHSVYNSSANIGYITRFDIRGRGVYLENTVSSKIEDENSITMFGETPASLDQKYQRSLYLGETIARSIVEQHKDAVSNLKSIKFNANSSKTLMRVLTVIDVGDLMHIKSSIGSIDGHYYIDRVKLTISQGDVYTVECLVEEKLSIKSGVLSEIGVEFRGEGFKDAINFGHLSYLADVPYRTMCAWLNFSPTPPNVQVDYIMGFFADGSAFELIADNGASPALGFYQKYTPNGQQFWFTPRFITRGTWYHVAVFKSLLADEDPKFYLNGQLITSSLVSTPPEFGKTAFSDAGVPFILGNIKTATIDYDWGFSGRMQDARVYNKQLSDLEVLQLYNGGVPDISVVGDINSLAFQALAVRTVDLASYIDQPMTGLSVFDNIFRAVGVAISSPIGRSPV